MKTNIAICIFDGEKMIHIWTFAGDPNYFPYEGMPCDCGELKYHQPEPDKFVHRNRLTSPLNLTG